MPLSITDMLRINNVGPRDYDAMVTAQSMISTHNRALMLRSSTVTTRTTSKPYMFNELDNTGRIMLYQQGLSPQVLPRNPYPYGKVYVGDSPVMSALAARQSGMQSAINTIRRVAQSIGIQPTNTTQTNGS